MLKIKQMYCVFIVLILQTSHCCGKKFDEQVLQKITQDSLTLAEEQRIGFVVQELHRLYGTTATPSFYLFNGGNAHGLIGLVYASLTEYLIIYGTPLYNGGHSGRYLMTIHDFVFRGKISIASPYCLEGKEVFPGEVTTLTWGTAHHYAMEPHTWMIEYGYGFTPSALPFMLLGMVVTGDLIGAGSLVTGYGTQVVKNLLPTNMILNM